MEVHRKSELHYMLAMSTVCSQLSMGVQRKHDKKSLKKIYKKYNKYITSYGGTQEGCLKIVLKN